MNGITEVTVGNTYGKHLIFKLENRDYGIFIGFVNEIIGLMDITPVPNTPLFLKGVINLRGKIIPVIDLRLKFSMKPKAYDERTCIIILNLEANGSQNNLMGLVVDMVSEVYDIPQSDIEPSGNCGINSNNKYLTGIGKIKDKIVMLLDVKETVNYKEINGIIKENNIEL